MFRKCLQKCVNIIYLLIVVWLWVCLLFFKLSQGSEYVYSMSGKEFISNHIPNLCFVVIWLGIAAVVFFLKKHFGMPQKDVTISNEKKPLAWKKELFIWMIVLAVWELFYVGHLWFYGGLDTFCAITDASAFVEGRLDETYHIFYLQQCPNNLYLHFVYVIAYYMGKQMGIDGYFVMLAVTMIGNVASVLLVGDVLHRILEKPWVARFGMGLALVLYLTTPFSIMPYTDILSVWIPILILDLYIWAKKEEKPVWLQWFLLGFFALNFYYLKALNLIIFLVIIICQIIGDKKWTKKNLVQFLAAMIVAVLLVKAFYAGVSNFMKYEPNDEVALPIGYYLITGLDVTTYGGFSYNSVIKMEEYGSSAEKNQAAVEIVKERFAQYGVVGYLKHFKNKTILFFGDGTLGWGYNAEMLGEIPQSDSYVTAVMRELFYPMKNYMMSNSDSGYGRYFMVYAGVIQFLWIGFLLLLTAYGWSLIHRKQQNVEWILQMSFIGVFLFCMLFEMSARLLLSYMPILIVLSAMGLAYIRKERIGNPQ